METPQQRWETRVIHLNLNNKPQSDAKPQAQQPEPPSDPQKPIFSDAYLKEEFPNHYNEAGEVRKPQPPTPPKPQHPATQLQSFMNKLGAEGWEFVGVYPVGQLTMMMFKRLLPPVPAEVPSAQPDTSLPSNQSVPEASRSLDQTNLHGVLQQILSRLDDLEQRQVSKLSPIPLPSSAVSTTATVLSPQQLNSLPTHEPLPTARAAIELGLRSPGSLLNYGARHGYPLGLVKVASNGMAAVYRGEATRNTGGKALRLWSVMPQSLLPER